jgi:dihydrofolate reductase
MISLIAALAKNRCIGRDNVLPWDLPREVKYFRDQTRGKPVIMGRKTFDSLGKALPQRRNIVVTRQADWSFLGVEVSSSLPGALALLKQQSAPDQEIMVIGGAEIYRLALPVADRLYLTLIDQEFEGDAYFPEWDLSQWKKTASRWDEESGTRYEITIWDRK